MNTENINQSSRSNSELGLRYLLGSDLYRYHGKTGMRVFIYEIFFGIGFKYTFWLRLCHQFRGRRLFLLLFIFSRLMLNRYMFRFGLCIDYMADIGPGLFIGHFGGIVVNERTRIGRNCNISQGVTIGQSNRGKLKGIPVIGNNVYIGPGAKLFGKITIGDNVAIGANAVVTKSIPDNSVVVGIPAKVISEDGSAGYINRIDYDR